VVRSFPPPGGGTCRALTFGKGFLFCGTTAGTIVIFNPSTLAVRGIIAAPGGGTAKVEGLAFNSLTDELFIANQSENRIYVAKVTL